MRVCKECGFKFGDDVLSCQFCGGKTAPAPKPEKKQEKTAQPYAQCNVCGFKLPADATKCPFCGGIVSVKGVARLKDESKPTEYQLLQEKATTMGLQFPANIGKAKLAAMIEEAEKAAKIAELEQQSEDDLRTAAVESGIELSDDDDKAAIISKILQAAKDE